MAGPVSSLSCCADGIAGKKLRPVLCSITRALVINRSSQNFALRSVSWSKRNAAILMTSSFSVVTIFHIRWELDGLHRLLAEAAFSRSDKGPVMT